MHMMFLGIEKNLMKQTSIIFDRQGSRDKGDSWKQLTTHMANTQRHLSGLSLSWCLSMPFSGPLKCGTANWQSDHCVTFTRSSLIYFAPLDRLYAKSTDSTKRILLAFKSVRVLWFCLVSRIMTDFEVSTCEIDSYIKLFLAACKRFHDSAVERMIQKDEDAAKKRLQKKKNNKKRQSKKGKGIKRKTSCDHSKTSEGLSTKEPKTTVDSSSSSSAKAKINKQPFFVTAPYYSCLTSVPEQINYLGSLRNSWEGGDEGYIQNVKRELTGMRHTSRYMKTILMKLLRTYFIEIVNENNSVHQEAEYERASNVKFLSTDVGVQEALRTKNVLCGLVGHDNGLYICQKATGGGHQLTRLLFDDHKGRMIYNLYYAPVTVHAETKRMDGIVDVKSFSKDYFFMARCEEAMDFNGWTVICRSWLVRNEFGKFQLPKEREAKFTWRLKPLPSKLQ